MLLRELKTLSKTVKWEIIRLNNKGPAYYPRVQNLKAKRTRLKAVIKNFKEAERNFRHLKVYS